MSYADEIFRRNANERVHAGCDEREDELEAEVARHKHEAYRLRAIMEEASKQDPATCRKWIIDALNAS